MIFLVCLHDGPIDCPPTEQPGSWHVSVVCLVVDRPDELLPGLSNL
jgi:hypothetical protein